MSVKLDFAIEVNVLRHISEDLSRTTIYTCPFCGEVLQYKKGEERRHHFAHKPDSNCSVSIETILHFNAKYYLKSQCDSLFGNKIFFDFHLKDHSNMINAISSILPIHDSLTVSLYDILLKYEALNGAKVEHKVGPYIADLYCPRYDDLGFVIEVCVTHEMESEKRQFLEERQIPYIELIPKQEQNNAMSFSLHSYYLPEFFEEKINKIESDLLDLFSNEFSDELLVKAKEPFKQTEILNHKKSAVDALKMEIIQKNFHHNIINILSDDAKKVKIQAYNSIARNKEPLHDIQYITNRERKKFLMINNKKYFVTSEQNLLYELINTLLSSHEIEALIGGWQDKKNQSVIGFNISMPNSKSLNELVKSILINILNDFETRFEKKLNTLHWQELKNTDRK